MLHAPVIIPTLNRWEHFQRCLDSLEKCIGANKTTVYVGLDFPPSDKYMEGWRKIDKYLTKKESNNGFECLNVIRRTYNCGVSGPEGNMNLLCAMAMEVYDRIIISEDDNEFAPSFLEFINKALEQYNDNPIVTSVCGYSQPSYNKVSVKTNQIFVQDNSAWGLGIWKSKESSLDKFDAKWCTDVLSSFSNVSMLMHRFPMLVSIMVNMLKNGVMYGDTVRTCSNILNGTLQVRPKISLVRNWGNDGSGVNCNKIIDTSSEALDMRSYFEFSDCTVERTKELDNAVYNILLPKNFILKYMKVAKIWCKYFLFRIGLIITKQYPYDSRETDN